MLFMVRKSSGGLVRRRRVNKDRKSQGNWKDRRKEKAFKTKIMRQDDQTKKNTEMSCLTQDMVTLLLSIMGTKYINKIYYNTAIN